MIGNGKLPMAMAVLGLLGAAGAARGTDNMLFVPLAPCRVIDTRLAGGPILAGRARTFFFRGPTRDYSAIQGGSSTGCGIPDLESDVWFFGVYRNTAAAVAINIVAVGPAGAGDLRAWPANQTIPGASVVNYAAVPGLNIANGVIVPMCDESSATPCANGDITIQADVSGAHVVVDVVGYFHASARNIALGHQALPDVTTGSNNVCIGWSAGQNVTTGDDNVLIANVGDASDSSTIRLGSYLHTRTFIAGIRGVTTGQNNAVPVLIDSTGQLGTASSSIRFKEDVHDLGPAADRVLALRPVSFRYKQPFADGEKPVQYGLIAEEVEKVFPELVAYGEDGRPESVKYQVLPTLLLGEVERQSRRLAEKDVEIAALRREDGAKLAALDEQVRRLLARIELIERERRGTGRSPLDGEPGSMP